MQPSLTPLLPGRVGAKYKSANAAQNLIFSPTELTVIHTSAGVPFQLRFCPSLAKKAHPSKDPAPKGLKVDVFDKPSPELLVTGLPMDSPTHNVVLNKFPIIPEHFILATVANKPQTHFLEKDDLSMAYTSLVDWDLQHDTNKQLFAFFNSGDHSGASQPHRHLQFLPVENMKADLPEGSSWDLLINSMTEQGSESTSPGALQQSNSLPFVHFAIRLPEIARNHLLPAYESLYSVAYKTVKEYISANPNTLALHPTEGGDLPISYNLAMTRTTMAIMPRRSEGSMLRRDDGSELGFVALNGTTLGGTLMVKHQEQWEELCAKPWKLDGILEEIGIPRKVDQARDGQTSAPSL
ncbi:5',5'''-P-1,P-4-tetraphosphate phosphorylase 2 [Amniculicola lignicola CBS 123094]|uniref:5',5'''-P-1,P-4-tetraphosphate phosphorylase 2 n=1 Tax=Amniculicola lignicola CBS 123094 TaxID=1392246 RepID=A0A6A5WFU0_9PLEO|nr:5',5'''-P-1,P-4-tetraphosphate phosphorylase 2 [Amniculicola lignicola CBS 123094]